MSHPRVMNKENSSKLLVEEVPTVKGGHESTLSPWIMGIMVSPFYEPYVS